MNYVLATFDIIAICCSIGLLTTDEDVQLLFSRKPETKKIGGSVDVIMTIFLFVYFIYLAGSHLYHLFY